MKRKAFAMKLKPGHEAEYERRHRQIWPEMKEALAAAGIVDYSIYLDRRTDTLFAVQKLNDQNSADELPALPVVRKWWDYMADIMEVNPDNSPVQADLDEVFHMESRDSQ